MKDQQARTLAFYETQAERYAEDTMGIPMDLAYERFLKRVPTQGRLLDAGSGSGRDTRAFLQRGYRVEAFDASPALAALSTQLTGVATKVMSFLEVDAVERYAGVWACASLLHVPRTEMALALTKLCQALQPGGILYASFRHGNAEVIASDGRAFTDMNLELASRVLAEVPSLSLIESWVDAGPSATGRVLEWFSMVCRKDGP